MISRRVPNARIGQLTLNEFLSIERFALYPSLGRAIREIISAQNRQVIMEEDIEAYPLVNMTIANVSSLSSKVLRNNMINPTDKMICLYKLGIVLDPGEVLSWTNRIRKLTSTRHKNILLRTVHGDIFSNSRLHRFGLRDSSNCSNCPELMETIEHRIKDCPKAIETWNKLNEIKSDIGLNPLSDLSLENLVGAKDRLSKVELALNAELILKLTTRSDNYCASQVVKSTLRIIGLSEPLPMGLKTSIKAAIERLR